MQNYAKRLSDAPQRLCWRVIGPIDPTPFPYGRGSRGRGAVGGVGKRIPWMGMLITCVNRLRWHRVRWIGLSSCVGRDSKVRFTIGPGNMVSVFEGQLCRTWYHISTSPDAGDERGSGGRKHILNLYHDTLTGVRRVLKSMHHP